MPGFLATTTARIIAIIVGVALLLLLIAFGLHEWQVARTNAARARLSASQGQAALDSGKDAVATVGAAGVREQGITQTGDDHAATIKAAPGANTPNSVELNRAARSGMCAYAANSGKPECVRQPVAGGLGKGR